LLAIPEKGYSTCCSLRCSQEEASSAVFLKRADGVRGAKTSTLVCGQVATAFALKRT